MGPTTRPRQIVRRVVMALAVALWLTGCGNRPFHDDSVRLRVEVGELDHGLVFVLPRGASLTVPCTAVAGTGGKYTIPTYSGALEVTARTPDGIRVVPSTWKMQLRESARDHASERTEFVIEATADAPLARHELVLEAKRDDGQVVSRTLTIEVIERDSSLLDSVVRNDWHWLTKPIGDCQLETSEQFAHLSDRHGNLKFLTSPETKVEKESSDGRVPAILEELKRGTTIRWDVNALIVGPDPEGHGRSRTTPIARSILILRDRE